MERIYLLSIKILKKNIVFVDIKQKCPKCEEGRKRYDKFVPDPEIDGYYTKRGFNPHRIEMLI
jgi:hypothetical protein